MFKTIEFGSVPLKLWHEYLLSTVAPRPVAWVSSVNKKGIVNLAPFSFFNCFGSNPPTVIFSPARRVRDNTIKHTLENLAATGECVINICNYELVGKMVLSSTEYPEEINEFKKTGLTELKSEMVSPPRVAESPAQLECKLKEIIATGNEGGAGNLIICEILCVHINEEVFDDDGSVNPKKMDQIARLGGIWYSRASEGLFKFPNPNTKQNIGFDGLPKFIRESNILTGNEISKLATIESLPEPEEINKFKNQNKLTDNFMMAKEALLENDIRTAILYLLSSESSEG